MKLQYINDRCSRAWRSARLLLPPELISIRQLEKNERIHFKKTWKHLSLSLSLSLSLPFSSYFLTLLLLKILWLFPTSSLSMAKQYRYQRKNWSSLYPRRYIYACDKGYAFVVEQMYTGMHPAKTLQS